MQKWAFLVVSEIFRKTKLFHWWFLLTIQFFIMYAECGANNFLHLAEQWKSVGCCENQVLAGKFQSLTDLCQSIYKLSFSAQYKCLPFLLVRPGGNNPEAALRRWDKTFLRFNKSYQQTAKLTVRSSLHISWSGPPPIFHCTGSAHLQWYLGGSGHENFSTLTASLTSVEPTSTDLAAPRQTLWAMSALHCTVRICSEGGDGISTRHHHFSVVAPSVIKHPGARYSSRC